jgi:hypothetical protein
MAFLTGNETSFVTGRAPVFKGDFSIPDCMSLRLLEKSCDKLTTGMLPLNRK